jgi:hypothetical protein
LATGLLRLIDPSDSAATPPPSSGSTPPDGAGPSSWPSHVWEQGRPPQPVAPGLWLFAPNRDTQGGSAWLLESHDLDLLIDCPALTEANLHFLSARGRRDGDPRAGRIVLTGRDGHGRCRRLQERLGWPVLVQEQEAYLLPGVGPLTSFGDTLSLAPGLLLLWTPGPGPGSCVLHAAASASAAGDGLFCGRLLQPVAPDRLEPLRSRRTFHWPRQLRSLARLRDQLPEGSPNWIATGAALGALRGGRLVPEGAALLAALRLDRAAEPPPL